MLYGSDRHHADRIIDEVGLMPHQTVVVPSVRVSSAGTSDKQRRSSSHSLGGLPAARKDARHMFAMWSSAMVSKWVRNLDSEQASHAMSRGDQEPLPRSERSSTFLTYAAEGCISQWLCCGPLASKQLELYLLRGCMMHVGLSAPVAISCSSVKLASRACAARRGRRLGLSHGRGRRDPPREVRPQKQRINRV